MKESRLRLFEVVAFGCHEHAHRRLARFLQSEFVGIHTYTFLEYFCVNPVPIVRVHDAWEKTDLFFPFIRRVVEENQFLWVSQDEADFRLRPKTNEVIGEFKDAATFRLPVRYANFGTKALEHWKDYGPPRKRDSSDRANSLPIWCHRAQDWSEYLSFIRCAPDDDRKILLKEYGLLGQPWVASGQDFLVFSFPIATQSIFYGYFLMFVPAPCNEGEGEILRNKVWDKLRELSEDLYLPVLMILAESLSEEDLSDQIDDALKTKKDWKSVAEEFMIPESAPFMDCAQDACSDNTHKKCPAPERPYDDHTERSLHRLWVRRKDMLGRLRDTEEARWKFLNTLAFEKYFVASPGLIKQLKDVMKVDFTIPKPRKRLHAALVYGGPGSGKEVMARLIPLFSPHYFYHNVHAVNMAAIRPDAITGPLFQGIKIAMSPGQKGNADREFMIEGLFLEAVGLEEKHQREGMNLADIKEDDWPLIAPVATFILDELNSLNVDLQGILLRILEQGEIMSLFGLEKKYVQHLIVGIVNEDPEEISRESDLRDLLVEKGKLGTLISGLLYETLRRTRRLREDLYHRLKRQRYIRMPEMKERLEDIPVLFYLFAAAEAKKKGHENLIVNLDAYRLLMDPRIRWPGNVRQVEAVALDSVQEALSRRSEDAAALVISRWHVLRAPSADFRGIKPDTIGGEKEGEIRKDDHTAM